MEERRVTISRAKVSIDYPANFMLVASMNPCPCGYYNHPDKECVCAPGVVQRYLVRSQRITPEGAPFSRHFSDVFLLGSANVGTGLALESSLQYSPDVGRAVLRLLEVPW